MRKPVLLQLECPTLSSLLYDTVLFNITTRSHQSENIINPLPNARLVFFPAAVTN